MLGVEEEDRRQRKDDVHSEGRYIVCIYVYVNIITVLASDFIGRSMKEHFTLGVTN